jgi:hypothetical protein
MTQADTMNQQLQDLMGAKVSFAMRDDAALMVVFEQDYALAVFNHWCLKNAKNEIGSDSLLIKGKTFSSFKEGRDFRSLNFEDMELSIDLREFAWEGPQAMVLYKRGVPMMVW